MADSSSYVRSDDVNIVTLQLNSADRSKNYDLSSICVAFDIYEDITFPCIRAEFTIIDALDLLNQFPIIGEELIDVEFGSPGNDLTNSYTFFVKAIENQIITQQGKVKSYIIRATSEEMFDSNKQIVSKKYHDSSDHIIRDIMNNVLYTEKVVACTDPPRGIQDVLITRLRPLQAIDMIRKRTSSQNYSSSSYCFFENKRGFNFCSIEYLMDQLQNNVSDKVFFYDTAGATDARNQNTRTILSLRNISQVNNTKKMAQGGLNNTVKKFDLLTGIVTAFNYINQEQQNKFKFASKKPIGLNTSAFEHKHGQKEAVTFLVPHSSHLPETFISDSMGARQAFIVKLQQNMYHAYVNGDPALTCGDVITINVPPGDGASTGSTSDNRLIAGNYLMSKVRHSILNNSAQQKSYRCSLELIKGSYEDHA